MPTELEKARAKVSANIILNDLMPRLNRAGIHISKSPITPQDVAGMAQLKLDGILSTHQIRNIIDTQCSLTT